MSRGRGVSRPAASSAAPCPSGGERRVNGLRVIDVPDIGSALARLGFDAPIRMAPDHSAR